MSPAWQVDSLPLSHLGSPGGPETWSVAELGHLPGSQVPPPPMKPPPGAFHICAYFEIKQSSASNSQGLY